MKNKICLVFPLLLCIGISVTCIAQNSSNNINLDAGLTYGFEVENIGFKGGGTYQINDQFRASADVIYYLPGEDSNGVEFNWLEFNLNGHYIFLNQENVGAYLLSGLNFSTFSSDSPNIRLPGGDRTDTIYAGLNIGAGAEFPLGSVVGFLEGKYALSSAHQLVFSGGLRIPL